MCIKIVSGIGESKSKKYLGKKYQRKITKKENPKKGVSQKWAKKVTTKSLEIGQKTQAEVKDEEEDANDVRERFRLGCECQDDRCFHGLNPDNVYK